MRSFEVCQRPNLATKLLDRVAYQAGVGDRSRRLPWVIAIRVKPLWFAIGQAMPVDDVHPRPEEGSITCPERGVIGVLPRARHTHSDQEDFPLACCLAHKRLTFSQADGSVRAQMDDNVARQPRTIGLHDGSRGTELTTHRKINDKSALFHSWDIHPHYGITDDDAALRRSRVGRWGSNRSPCNQSCARDTNREPPSPPLTGHVNHLKIMR